MTVKIKKRYIINKVKFIRFILSCVIITLCLVWLISTMIIGSCNTICKQDEIIVNTIDDNVITNSNYISSDETIDTIFNTAEPIIDYSIKPDGLENIYFESIVYIASEEQIPLEVILAIVTTENETYNVNATCKNTNGTIDMGLCQINSAYVDYFAKLYNIESLNPYDVKDSVTFVARHIKYLSNYAMTNYDLSEFDSYVFAAGAYNRGLTNECKYRNMYHYKEKFLANYNKFI